ncbi:MAG: DAK2 domain-containing protein [Chloroflexota bacterium]|jgi:hypothetical protein|nr:DAK2 domain-containing protein [Chloroflexota bacterium]
MVESGSNVRTGVSDRLRTGLSLHHGFEHSLAWLKANSEAIDRLNVFPVPDGDTGTNMVLTLQAALDEIESRKALTASDVAAAAARGSLMGARGNSGVILSQIIAGLANGLEGLDEFSAEDFARGLASAYEVAYASVTEPVEGTILTVARHAGTAAVDATRNGDETVDGVITAAVKAAERSVEDTPNRLAVLKEAGVVDAGGQGLSIILDGFLKFSRGEEIAVEANVERAEMVFAAYADEHAADEQGYCTQFIIEGETLDVPAIREFIAAATDSTIVVGDAAMIRVHCHTETPGDMLNYAGGFGELSHISIENMQLQQAEHFEKIESADPDTVAPRADFVAVAPGPGFAAIFDSLGAAIVEGGQTMNPSTAQILEAIASCPGDAAVVLPNNSNIIMASRQAAEASPKTVRVIETRTVPQGVAAALTFNPTADFDSNCETMQIAAGEPTVLEVTRATRDAEIDGVRTVTGQHIGLLDDQLVTADDSAVAVVADLAGRAADVDVDIITIYLGADISEDGAGDVVQTLETAFPDAEIDLVSGGQTHYDYIISLE